MKSRISVPQMVLCALFAALTAVCAQLTIHIGPVPISLSLLPVLLWAALTEPKASALMPVLYLVMGLAGLPVFSGMTGGPGKLLGPTGGYIVGYIPCACVISLWAARRGRGWKAQAAGMAAGVAVCYALGTAWFMASTSRTLGESLGLCVTPFLPGDALKIALAVFLSIRLEPAYRRAVRG